MVHSTNVFAHLSTTAIWLTSNFHGVNQSLDLRLDITIVILFFGEGHGKGPYDGSGGDWVAWYHKNAHRVIAFLQELLEKGELSPEEAEQIGLSHLKDIEKLANDPEHGFVQVKSPKKVKDENGISLSHKCCFVKTYLDLLRKPQMKFLNSKLKSTI